MEIALLLLIAGAFVAIWLVTQQIEKKRRQRVIDLAKQLALELHWLLPDEDRNRFSRFDLSGKGRNQHAGMTLIADNGDTRITLFDYSFVTGNGKNKSTHHWAVAQCRDARLTAPDLQIEPETWVSRVGSLVGYQDIDIPEDPEFSKKFLVRGGAEEAIRAFLTLERRAALLEHPTQRMAIRGDTMILTRPRMKLDAKHVKPLLSDSLRMVNVMLPA